MKRTITLTGPAVAQDELDDGQNPRPRSSPKR